MKQGMWEAEGATSMQALGRQCLCVYYFPVAAVTNHLTASLMAETQQRFILLQFWRPDV